MGNCFGKQNGNFRGEGRTVGAEAARPAQAGYGSIPSSAPQPGRVVGGQGDNGLSPKEAAARAAETRAAAQGQNKGALGQKLNQQQKQSQSATLAQSARDNVAARDSDTAAEVRNYN